MQKYRSRVLLGSPVIQKIGSEELILFTGVGLLEHLRSQNKDEKLKPAELWHLLRDGGVFKKQVKIGHLNKQLWCITLDVEKISQYDIVDEIETETPETARFLMFRRSNELAVPMATASRVQVSKAENGRFHVTGPARHQDLMRNIPQKNFLKFLGVFEAVPVAANIRYFIRLCEDHHETVSFTPEAVQYLHTLSELSNRTVNRVPFPLSYPFKRDPWPFQRECLDYIYNLKTTLPGHGPRIR